MELVVSSPCSAIVSEGASSKVDMVTLRRYFAVFKQARKF